MVTAEGAITFCRYVVQDVRAPGLDKVPPTRKNQVGLSARQPGGC